MVGCAAVPRRAVVLEGRAIGEGCPAGREALQGLDPARIESALHTHRQGDLFPYPDPPLDIRG